MADEWWASFFDDDYLRIWGQTRREEDSEAEADGLWDLLGLREDSRMLDAPCGYGRLSVRLARRGAVVVGVDQSKALIAKAEASRGDLPAERLRYLRHDLRAPLGEGGFDAAIDVFSAVGYGTEDDDVAIFRTLAAAVRPGGLVFVETMQRDGVVARFAAGIPGHRLDDGTLVVEKPRFDPIAGRIGTTWHWSGPAGTGSKSASLRVYTATEIVGLLGRAGLRFVSAHRGCTREPFDPAGRLGVLCARE